MKNIGYLWGLMIWLLSVKVLSAQTTAPTDLAPYFNALLVKDVKTSSHWYQDILGYEIVSETQIAEGFEIMNLKRESTALELIQLPTAISPEEAIPNYHSKTRILGFFKMGYQVSNLDQWVSFLKEKGVSFNGSIVEDPVTKKRMVIILDPDGNRIQLFEQ